MNDKFGVVVGRDENVKIAPIASNQNKSMTKPKSKKEKKVIELLHLKHAVSPTKWKKLDRSEKEILEGLALDREYEWRTKAITALVMSEDIKHVELLRRIINDEAENNLVRSVAAISLGMSNSPQAGKVLAQFIDDKDEFVRAKVAESLGKVGGSEALEVLKRATKDDSPLVKSNAIDSINLLAFRLGIKKDEDSSD